MTEDIEKREEEESLMDYASRRLVELKNAEQKFVNNLTIAQANLEKAHADLISCRGRIDEMLRIINDTESGLPAKP